MDPKMFCFQCQETAGNTGCLIKGVCGKEASTARLQDLLLFVVRGISVLERELRRLGQDIDVEVYHFNTDALIDIRLIPQSFNAVVNEKALLPESGSREAPTFLQFFLEPFNPLSLPAWRERTTTLFDLIRRKL